MTCGEVYNQFQRPLYWHSSTTLATRSAVAACAHKAITCDGGRVTNPKLAEVASGEWRLDMACCCSTKLHIPPRACVPRDNFAVTSATLSSHTAASMRAQGQLRRYICYSQFTYRREDACPGTTSPLHLLLLVHIPPRACVPRDNFTVTSATLSSHTAASMRAQGQLRRYICYSQFTYRREDACPGTTSPLHLLLSVHILPRASKPRDNFVVTFATLSSHTAASMRARGQLHRYICYSQFTYRRENACPGTTSQLHLLLSVHILPRACVPRDNFAATSATLSSHTAASMRARRQLRRYICYSQFTYRRENACPGTTSQLHLLLSVHILPRACVPRDNFAVTSATLRSHTAARMRARGQLRRYICYSQVTHRRENACPGTTSPLHLLLSVHIPPRACVPGDNFAVTSATLSSHTAASMRAQGQLRRYICYSQFTYRREDACLGQLRRYICYSQFTYRREHPSPGTTSPLHLLLSVHTPPRECVPGDNFAVTSATLSSHTAARMRARGQLRRYICYSQFTYCREHACPGTTSPLHLLLSVHIPPRECVPGDNFAVTSATLSSHTAASMRAQGQLRRYICYSQFTYRREDACLGQLRLHIPPRECVPGDNFAVTSATLSSHTAASIQAQGQLRSYICYSQFTYRREHACPGTTSPLHLLHSVQYADIARTRVATSHIRRSPGTTSPLHLLLSVHILPRACVPGTTSPLHLLLSVHIPPRECVPGTTSPLHLLLSVHILPRACPAQGQLRRYICYSQFTYRREHACPGTTSPLHLLLSVHILPRACVPRDNFAVTSATLSSHTAASMRARGQLRRYICYSQFTYRRERACPGTTSPLHLLLSVHILPRPCVPGDNFADTSPSLSSHTAASMRARGQLRRYISYSQFTHRREHACPGTTSPLLLLLSVHILLRACVPGDNFAVTSATLSSHTAASMRARGQLRRYICYSQFTYRRERACPGQLRRYICYSQFTYRHEHACPGTTLILIVKTRGPAESSGRILIICDDPGATPAGNSTWLTLVGVEQANRVRFSHAGVVLDDTAGRGVFSGICCFPSPCIPVLLLTRLASTSSALKTSMLRAAQISSLTVPLFPAFETEKRGRDRGDFATNIKCPIAAKREALNWCAVFSSHSRFEKALLSHVGVLCNVVIQRFEKALLSHVGVLGNVVIQRFEKALLSHVGVLCNVVIQRFEKALLSHVGVLCNVVIQRFEKALLSHVGVLCNVVIQRFEKALLSHVGVLCNVVIQRFEKALLSHVGVLCNVVIQRFEKALLSHVGVLCNVVIQRFEKALLSHVGVLCNVVIQRFEKALLSHAGVLCNVVIQRFEKALLSHVGVLCNVVIQRFEKALLSHVGVLGNAVSNMGDVLKAKHSTAPSPEVARVAVTSWVRRTSAAGRQRPSSRPQCCADKHSDPRFQCLLTVLVVLVSVVVVGVSLPGKGEVGWETSPCPLRYTRLQTTAATGIPSPLHHRVTVSIGFCLSDSLRIDKITEGSSFLGSDTTCPSHIASLLEAGTLTNQGSPCNNREVRGVEVGGDGDGEEESDGSLMRERGGRGVDVFGAGWQLCEKVRSVDPPRSAYQGLESRILLSGSEEMHVEATRAVKSIAPQASKMAVHAGFDTDKIRCSSRVHPQATGSPRAVIHYSNTSQVSRVLEVISVSVADWCFSDSSPERSTVDGQHEELPAMARAPPKVRLRRFRQLGQEDGSDILLDLKTTWLSERVQEGSLSVHRRSLYLLRSLLGVGAAERSLCDVKSERESTLSANSDTALIKVFTTERQNVSCNR
ncbi:hypothetical protein PR048_016417 [Dryococelus australis]|uniref:Uncharacterized protein n=1 Tax=Dryococelus australis TaxID=614101 RepID=A0ABQ9HK34_9NEOP|nr:hypothetical protein PR048_016417 [Dryococelus australis]